MAKTRRTHKNKMGKGKVLDVRSAKHLKMFENLIVQGPLTIVFVKAKWCGACHRFNDEVWNSLTKLKNRNMNLASVDSEIIGQTSLANVPRKFYPTLLLVGKDKKPATFTDEDGTPTNAMPRNNTLEEDREALSNLVQSPTTVHLSPSNMSPSATTAQSNLAKSPYSTMVSMPLEDTIYRQTPYPEPMASQPMASQPMASRPVASQPMASQPMAPRTISITPPDIGSDLVASQTQSKTGTSGVLGETTRGGGLLDAIRSKTASLKAMLHLRRHGTSKRHGTKKHGTKKHR